MSESSVPRIRLRVENLSDLVFGLALSIGSIILVSKLPQTPADLVSGVVLFGFSFLIIVWIWFGYTRTMAVLPYEVRGTLLLNIMLLFCVAVSPYLFYVLAESAVGLLDFASSFYAFDVGAMMFIQAGLIYILLGEEKRSGAQGLPPALLGRFRRTMVAQISVGMIFVASVLPFLWIRVPLGAFLRFDVWYAALVILFVVPRAGKRA